MRRYCFCFVAVLALFALLVAPKAAMAAPADDPATCSISCNVGQIMEWSAANFSAINLADITSLTATPEGQADLTLYTNGAATITADNTATAQLASGGDTLTTKYQLAYDGDGASATGGTDVGTWTDYTTFISGGSAVTHISGDGAVVVTLKVQASVSGAEAPDVASYSATQTLTVAWG